MNKVFKNFVGIDISKTWFDAAFISSDDLSGLNHQQFAQTPDGYRKMQAWLLQQDVCLNEETLFCMGSIPAFIIPVWFNTWQHNTHRYG